QTTTTGGQTPLRKPQRETLGRPLRDASQPDRRGSATSRHQLCELHPAVCKPGPKGGICSPTHCVARAEKRSFGSLLSPTAERQPSRHPSRLARTPCSAGDASSQHLAACRRRPATTTGGFS